MFVGFPSLEGFHLLSMQHIFAHVRRMDHSVVLPFTKHFSERTKQVEKVEEGI